MHIIQYTEYNAYNTMHTPPPILHNLMVLCQDQKEFHLVAYQLGSSPKRLVLWPQNNRGKEGLNHLVI